MAPLTRFRAVGEGSVPNEMHVEYYSQRATDGGLLITEGTFISEEAGGYPNVPGIYTSDQIKGWKAVTDAVHAKGGLIYCQLWAIGRANPGMIPGIKIVSSSNLAYEGGKTPEPLTVDDIKRYVENYRKAAQAAIAAGFDGVEIHSAHGYLLDQFLQESCNCTRNDEYSGSAAGRIKFLMEVLEAVTGQVGQSRVAVRLSPFSDFQGMGKEKDPLESFAFVCQNLKKYRLAYVSVTDPKLDDTVGGSELGKLYSTDYLRAIFRGAQISSKFSEDATTIFEDANGDHSTLFLSAGGYTASDAEPHSDRTGDLVGYGRAFIANPDLVHRLRHGLELNAYDRSTFYSQGADGYTDYPFATVDTPKYIPPNPLALKNKQLETRIKLIKKQKEIEFEQLLGEKRDLEHRLAESLKEVEKAQSIIAELEEKEKNRQPPAAPTMSTAVSPVPTRAPYVEKESGCFSCFS